MSGFYVPQGLAETSPGIWERTAPGPAYDSPPVEADYRARGRQILEADRPSYDRLAPCLHREAPMLWGWPEVWAFGGGLPKLESYMAAGRIVVVDALADAWRASERDFDDLYPWHPEVVWRNGRFTAASVAACGRPQAMATFVHVLEHLPPAEGAACVAAALRAFGLVFVYGPCIEACHGERWIHAPIQDHITYHTLKAMAKVFTDAGAQILLAARVADDLAVVGRLKPGAAAALNAKLAYATASAESAVPVGCPA